MWLISLGLLLAKSSFDVVFLPSWILCLWNILYESYRSTFSWRTWYEWWKLCSTFELLFEILLLWATIFPLQIIIKFFDLFREWLWAWVIKSICRRRRQRRIEILSNVNIRNINHRISSNKGRTSNKRRPLISAAHLGIHIEISATLK